MSDCERFHEQISALFDGELSAEEEAEVRTHIAGCAECAAMYEAFSAVGDALRADAAELPATLHDGIMAKIAMAEKARKTQNKIIRLRPIMTAAACVIVLAGTLLALKNSTDMRKTAATETAAAPEAIYAAGGASAGTTEEAAAEDAPLIMAAKAESAEADMAEAAEAEADAGYGADANVNGTVESPASARTEGSALDTAPAAKSASQTEAAAEEKTFTLTVRLTEITPKGFTGVVTDAGDQTRYAVDEEVSVVAGLGAEADALAPGTLLTVTYAASGQSQDGAIRAIEVTPVN